MARLRARSYPLRWRTISSSLAASKALIESPSSAANIRASRKTSASSLSVIFVFMVSTELRAARYYVLLSLLASPYLSLRCAKRYQPPCAIPNETASRIDPKASIDNFETEFLDYRVGEHVFSDALDLQFGFLPAQAI